MGIQRLNMVAFLLVIGIAALQLKSSDAKKTHIVGGSNGTWSVPQNASFYSTWAASQTFAVGDVLVFNFTTGYHTVAHVTKAAYDSCTTTNPISSTVTGPASVTLNSTGTHYFICQFTGHCSYGQKLAVTVGGSGSPAPAAEPTVSPTPAPTPAATPPATTNKTHTVGGSSGWSVPTNASFYTTWAASQSFAVGDVLLFNFTTGYHTVAHVTKAAYDSCNTASPISSSVTGPARVTLNSTGTSYFICQFTGHCSYGQKLAVTVGSSGTPASGPGSSPPPASGPGSSATPPSPGTTGTPGSSNSASYIAAALPVTFLSVALVALFY